MNEQFRFHVFRVPAWQLWLGGMLAFAIAAALVVVATGFFLILLPFVLASALLYRLFYGISSYSNPKQQQDGRVIETEYTVIDDGKPERSPSRRLSDRF